MTAMLYSNFLLSNLQKQWTRTSGEQMTEKMHMRPRDERVDPSIPHELLVERLRRSCRNHFLSTVELLCLQSKPPRDESTNGTISPVVQLPERVLTAVCEAEHATRDCDGFLFNICLSYGARQEIANACRQIAGEVAR